MRMRNSKCGMRNADAASVRIVRALRVPHSAFTIPHSRRRRGSILVLVMTVLGLLFVTGVVFMTTMSFEASMLDAERQRNLSRPGIGRVEVEVRDLLAGSLTPRAGESDLVTGDLLGGPPLAFAELPGVHNNFSPTEPYFEPSYYGPNQGTYALRWGTDPAALSAVDANRRRSFAGTDMTMTARFYDPVERPNRYIPPLDTTWRAGEPLQPPSFGNVPPFTPVDADGDGIVDAIQTDFAALPGVKASQVRKLAELLNPASNPDGKVNLGLRVVPHGGMATLGESHPSIIAAVLGPQSVDTKTYKLRWQIPYSPVVEEPPLRRRNFLAPYELPPTAIQGNPYGLDPDTGGGDFAAYLFAPNERLFTGEHRYWPFKPRETGRDPNFSLWSLRMEPNLWTWDYGRGDEYDRRHLVTSVSYDDLLRRPVYLPAKVDVGAGYFKIEYNGSEALDRMRQANHNFGLTSCSWLNSAPATLLPFEYANYPYLLPNQFHGVNDFKPPFDVYDPCACAGTAGCSFDPRKGMLRLSLPWIDDFFGTASPPGVHDPRKIRLIQDVFTLMLYNAREDGGDGDWGMWENVTIGFDQVTGQPIQQVVWKHNFLQIAKTAASLTANLLDYADADDEPTRVEVREADWTVPTTYGQPKSPPEYVYGLEHQPFITEVVAIAEDDGNGKVDYSRPHLFGVELFNPSGRGLFIAANQYSLKVLGNNPTPVTVPVPSTGISPGEFVGFFFNDSNDDSALGSHLKGRTVDLPSPPEFVFNESATIQLVRRVGGDDVVVDEINLSGGKVGKLGEGLWSVQRVANGIGPSRWNAPIPVENVSAVQSMMPTFGLGSGLGAAVSPVRVEFANTGTLRSAFPTTGSLLMLMRVANTQSEAFTRHLTEKDASGNKYAVDNGRMPVFDSAFNHHVDPKADPTRISDAATVNGTTLDRPGDVMHLPWGQLVFDYFTTLPLTAPGPYAINPADGLLLIDPHAPPRVTDDGLRVHGRVNLNAAPWKVLEGVPFVAMDRIPLPFRNDFQSALALDPLKSAEPQPIGAKLAKAVVAYRELREIDNAPASAQGTGNYADGSFNGIATTTEKGRGWTVDGPTVRRGTGLMTIGELANVRHLGALADYRWDSAELGNTSGTTAPDFVYAVAALASLSDWVTVRSHVFTAYGVLRGDMDLTIVEDLDPPKEMELRIQDVDSRALRFQMTIDRTPVLNGGTSPELIGEMYLGKYLDTRGG